MKKFLERVFKKTVKSARILSDKKLELKEHKKRLENLSELEIYSYADYVDGWLKLWGKNKDQGNYGKLWDLFISLKEEGLEGDKSYQQLGEFGLNLLNYILYSFQEYEDKQEREDKEPILLDSIITLHLLMNYLGKNLPSNNQG